jgi:hypothetical protein
MGRRHIGWCLLKLFIDQVCDGFSEGREGRRRLCPTHGQPGRDGNEWGFTRQVWKRHSEFEGSGWSEWKLVETIGQVSLGEKNWPMALISREDIPQETMESASPLHGFRWCTMNGVRIDRGIVVVVDHTWAAFTLGDTTDRREKQLLHVLEEVVKVYRFHYYD